MLKSLKRRGLAIGPLLVEVLSIVLAVALGFAVTEWREDRADRATADAAFRSIAAELELNHQQVAARADYYAAMTRTLDSLLAARGDVGISQVEVPGWRGINAPLLRRSSYEVAAVTGALALLPFETADAFARVYSVDEAITKTVDGALEALLAGRLQTIAEWRRLFSLLNEFTRIATYTYEQTARPVLEQRGGGDGE